MEGMTKRLVVLRFVQPVLGTVPKNRELYSDFIESKASKRIEQPGEEPLLPESERETVVEELEEAGWTGFHQRPQERGGALFVYDYYVKGYLKNAANVLKDSLGGFSRKRDSGGFSNLKSHVNNYVFVNPREVAITDAQGNELTAPDDVLPRPLRAMTAQGPRVSLVKSDLIQAGRLLKFEVVIVPGHPFKHEDELVGRLLEYAAYQGFGQWRNGGYGRAEVVKDEAVK